MNSTEGRTPPVPSPRPAEVERLSAELADARAQLADVKQAAWDAYRILGFDTNGDDEPHITYPPFPQFIRDFATEARKDLDEACDEASAAERARLEAVQANALGIVQRWHHDQTLISRQHVEAFLAALSAASPTTSDDERRPKRYDQCDDTCTVDCGHCKGKGSPAASDEPARCDHGKTEAHTIPVHLAGFGCPGPAASGTPETTR